eukprot:Hpha_TRINITY_DN15025_c0_g3::TRINITY_DN15025_c0_g3_i1::g.123223::m.123223
MVEIQDMEKQVFEAMNKVRQQPSCIADEIEAEMAHFKDKVLTRPGSRCGLMTQEGPSCWKEAADALRKQLPVGPLVMKDGLVLAGRDHAADQGPGGATGHTGSDGSNPGKRIAKYGVSMGWGENIQYGKPACGMDIVKQLIIDDGVPSRGHRKNIFKADFTCIGVGVGSHSKYQDMCVQVFGINYKDKHTGSAQDKAAEKIQKIQRGKAERAQATSMKQKLAQTENCDHCKKALPGGCGGRVNARANLMGEDISAVLHKECVQAWQQKLMEDMMAKMQAQGGCCRPCPARKASDAPAPPGAAGTGIKAVKAMSPTKSTPPEAAADPPAQLAAAPADAPAPKPAPKKAE